MALKGKNAWKALEGKKETATEKVPLEIFGEEVEFTVKYREPEDVQKINDEFDKKLPDKPIVKIDLGDKKLEFRVPIEKDKFKQFKDHPEVESAREEYEEKVEPINKRRSARIAYEFLIEDDRPGEDVEEGVDIILDRIRITDISEIVQAGMKLIGLSDNLDEARKNS